MKSVNLLSLAVLLTFCAPRPGEARAAAAVPDTCDQTAAALHRAALKSAQADFVLAFAACLNTTDPREAQECLAEAADELRESLGLAGEQLAARLELCSLLGGGAYDPEYAPADFSTAIDNPYMPLAPGTTWTYVKADGEETEQVVVAVTDETRFVDGVECVVVRDTVSVDGELVEDTLDYFAQDQDGNVWYFGEISLNFEDGELADIEGSWEAGEDGAKPGIVMLAKPEVGTTYRQEFLLAEAEDAASVLALDAQVRVPFGSFAGCLQTLDFSPLEPGSFEHKFYAPGVGLVLEVDVESGERLELLSVTTR